MVLQKGFKLIVTGGYVLPVTFKKKRIFIFFLMLIFFFINAQNIEVYYKLNMKPDKNDKSLVENDVFILNVNKDSSIFYSLSYAKMMGNLELSAMKNVDINKISNNFIVFKEKQDVYHLLRIESELIKYKETEMPKWQIGKDQKVISNYKCTIATTSYRGREYTAWFTEDVPVSEGPYKFKNLPGLVVEIYSDDGDYHFALEGLKQSKQKIKIPTSLDVKTRSNYLVEVKKFADDPSYKARFKDTSNSFEYDTFINGKKVTNEEKYKLINQFVWDFMKTHNNPIEKDDIWIR